MADLFQSLSHADDAGLLYVTDERPGIVRRRRGKGFSYHRPDGALVDDDERARIEAMAIPPAWTDVWICPTPEGHILATGRDDRGRKQYLYHPRWRTIRDADKWDRLPDFGAALPDLRRQVDADLRKRGLPEEKVLAAVVRLLDDTLIRIGNDAYADANETYGLTTLRQEHADVTGAAVRFEFSSKGGSERDVLLRDRRLATIVQACQELPGEELFQYVDDDDRVIDVSSTNVNDYLRGACGATVTAKDFRTWGGTVVAAETLVDLGDPLPGREADQQLLVAVDAAADALGNTRAVCRSCYVHPGVGTAWRDGALQDAWRSSRATGTMRRGERAVLKVLGHERYSAVRTLLEADGEDADAADAGGDAEAA